MSVLRHTFNPRIEETETEGQPWINCEFEATWTI